MPVHPDALARGGADYLTRVFHAAGSLPAGNRVVNIARIDDCPGGSTGRKLFLTVDYASPDAALDRRLFVKFSRDLDDPIRDRARFELDAEVRLARLSREAGFPVTVPTCYFADFHGASGTGVLITACVPFGEDGIEPHRPKCLDYSLPDPLEHYRALVRALARLGAAHRSGRLGDAVERQFLWVPERQFIAQPIRYDAEQLQRRVRRYAEFSRRHPALLRDHLREPGFMDQMMADIPVFLRAEQALKHWLLEDRDGIALMHWNANIDNAWFRRGPYGALDCGLMDWGNVGQMNMALALWGALCATELWIWDEHLDALLTVFVDELRAGGGPSLDVGRLRDQLVLGVVLLGLGWLMDAPALIERACPELEQVTDRRDPVFAANETARTQLQMLTSFLNVWQRHRPADLIDAVLAR